MYLKSFEVIMSTTRGPTLSDNLAKLADSDFAEDSFRALLEDHLPNIKQSTNSRFLDVDPAEAYHYKNNFYGLLYAMRIEPKYHWIVMRSNDIKSSLLFDGILPKILHPDLNMIDSLYGTWRTRYRSM